MGALSKVAQGLIGQPMFGLLAKSRKMEAEGKRVVHFEIGDPNFRSPFEAVEAAKAALDAGMTHYTDSMGTREFREAIQNYVEADCGFRPSLGQILICPANAIIDFTARCLVNPGEEVVYPDPGFPTYHSVINYNGMAPVGVPLRTENGFRMNPDDVRSRITNKTRLIIINTPHNPTGSVMSKEEILDIARIAQQRDIHLLSDEVYAKIVYDGAHYSPCVLDQCRERTIVLGSLSKMYSMSGWRLGYAVGPEELIAKMGLLLQTIMSCLPAFTQAGGVAALRADNRALSDGISTLRKRRDVLIRGLNKLPGISCIMPEGAFYAFADITGTNMSSDEYSECLLNETGVCVLPGTCFGRFGRGYVRLCYASTTTEAIEEALKKMGEFHAKRCFGLQPVEVRIEERKLAPMAATSVKADMEC